MESRAPINRPLRYHAPMVDLNSLPLEDVYHELRRVGSGGGAGGGLITRLIELARDEDLGDSWESGDVTTAAFIPGWRKMTTQIVSRSAGTIAGLACIEEVLDVYKADVDVTLMARDGQRVAAGEVVAQLTGLAGKMVTAERVLLNLIGRMSGIATRTAEFVQLAQRGAPAHAKGPNGAGVGRVFDTRKTMPGMRLLEKYAVRCGGGFCHRLGLYDAVLIKDNHLASSGGVSDVASAVKVAVKRARTEAPKQGLRFVMLEVDRFEQFEQILKGGAAGRSDEQVSIILLDNMQPEQLSRCVNLRNEMKVPVELEASGGVSLSTIEAIAASGVDRISTGSLTHGATWLDVGLDAVEGK
jgi:nicotinate-nucleotide pyrophosphorylase (carboxylating)